MNRKTSTIAILGSGLFGLMGCFAAPSYQGKVSDNFNGEVFINLGQVEDKGFDDFLQWRRTRDQGPWPEWVDAQPGPPPPTRVTSGELRVTFINHSTLLLQVDGLNILTDPIWSERTSPLSWAGPKRVRPPGLRFEDLPPIDAVLISHNHYDHLDIPTLERLAADHGPQIFAGLGNRALLESEGIGGATDMDWWQSEGLGDEVCLTAVPAQHFSGRGLFDRNETLWMGFVLETSSGVVYFAGDTGFGPHFEQIRARFGAVRVALLPIGAFRPRFFMKAMHMSPEESVLAHQVLEAEISVAMHFGTFPLADEGMDRPVEELDEALARAQVTRESFWVLGFGEGRRLLQ